jgi:hypothetical protein
MKQWYGIIIIGLCLTGAVGCGGGVEETTEKVIVITPEERLKAMMEQSAKDGQPLGSGGSVVTEAIEEIKKKDPAKGAALEEAAKDLNQQDPNKIKASAKAVLSKL